MASSPASHLTYSHESTRALQWVLDHVGAVVYIAGPMHGQPGHGYPAFHEAEAKLWAFGLVPISPARSAPPIETIETIEKLVQFRDSALYKAMLRRCIGDILQSEAIFMLPGWQHSRGAKLEESVASAIGLMVLDGGWLLRSGYATGGPVSAEAAARLANEIEANSP